MLTKFIVCNFIIAGLIFCIPSYKVEYKRVEAPIIVKKVSISDLIAQSADKYNVSEKTMHQVVKCESMYNPNAVGDGGKSFGLVQIYLPSNPTVTKEEALNPNYAIDFLAKGLSKGQGSKWTCFRITKNV